MFRKKCQSLDDLDNYNAHPTSTPMAPTMVSTFFCRLTTFFISEATLLLEMYVSSSVRFTFYGCYLFFVTTSLSVTTNLLLFALKLLIVLSQFSYPVGFLKLPHPNCQKFDYLYS